MAERQLRVASDAELDDTALELEHERFAVALETYGRRHILLVKRILIDGTVTPAEGLELIEDAMEYHRGTAVNRQGCAASVARNVGVQRELEAFAEELRGFVRQRDPALRDAHRWLRADCGDCTTCRSEVCHLVGRANSPAADLRPAA
jgi:hypothetical protein